MALETTIVANQLNHYYGTGRLRRQVLFDINLQIQMGEIVIMTGPSGSGKTTLLTLMGGLRAVQEGNLHVLGQQMRGVSSGRLEKIRRQIGFIFQDHNLLSSLNAIKNVEMAAALYPISAKKSKAQSKAALEAVGLGKHLYSRPNQLSGGQKQRVAIARALVNKPQIILADEPTASLDGHTGREVVELMQHLAKQQGCTIILVTHDNRILDIADRIISLEDGRLSASKGEFLLGLSNLTSFILETDVNAIHNLIQPLSSSQFSDFLNKLNRELEQAISSIKLLRYRSFNSKLQITFQAISLKIAQLLKAEQVTFFVVDHIRKTLWSKNARGKDGQLISIEIPIDSGIAGYVATTGETLNIAEPYSDKRFNPQVDSDTGFCTRNILCLPIINDRNEVFAVIQALNKAGDLPFDYKDEENFFELTRSLGFTVESSILYTQQIYHSITPSILQTNIDELRTKVTTLLQTNVDGLRAKVTALSIEKFIDFLNGLNLEIQRLMNSGLAFNHPVMKDKMKGLIEIISCKMSQVLKVEIINLFIVNLQRQTLHAGNTLMRKNGQCCTVEVPISTGIAGAVAMTGKSIMIHNPYQDSRFDSQIDQDTGVKTRNILATPIFDQSTGEVIAVIQALNKLGSDDFLLEDQARITDFVDNLGIVLQTSIKFLQTSFS
ncbi:MAG: ATP-binding cassette domain-containing protein [Cyanobacteria bacterium P01_F01_bin.86]